MGMRSVLWGPDHLEADWDWRGVDPGQPETPESSQSTASQMDIAHNILNGEVPEHTSLTGSGSLDVTCVYGRT